MVVKNGGELERALKDLGYRLTPQRTLILEVIRGCDDHISAEQIYARVRELYPYVNISTVYRTLDLLTGLALVTKTNLGEGHVLYHWAEKGNHHHLICQKCGAVSSLNDDLLEPLKHTICLKFGFHANLDHMAIFGRCAKCGPSSPRGVGPQ